MAMYMGPREKKSDYKGTLNNFQVSFIYIDFYDTPTISNLISTGHAYSSSTRVTISGAFVLLFDFLFFLRLVPARDLIFYSGSPHQ